MILLTPLSVALAPHSSPTWQHQVLDAPPMKPKAARPGDINRVRLRFKIPAKLLTYTCIAHWVPSEQFLPAHC